MMDELDKKLLKKMGIFLLAKVVGYAAIRMIMRSISRG